MMSDTFRVTGPAAAWMRAQGHEHWTSVVGLRYDEPARVHKLRNREVDEWDVACPLYDARVVKRHVTDFWKRQLFDLGLRRFPRARCTCGAVRGHGHALHCARVLGERRAA